MELETIEGNLQNKKEYEKSNHKNNQGNYHFAVKTKQFFFK